MMIPKKPVLFLFSLLVIQSCVELSAQTKRPHNLIHFDHKPYNFGFTLGINQMLFSIEHMPLYTHTIYTPEQTPDIPADWARLNTVESNPNWGFTIGIVSNLRLANYFDLRFIPSLSFGERNLEYLIEREFQGVVENIIVRKPIQSTFVDFPLLVKYKSKRLNNIRSYLIAGPKYSIDLISDARRSEKTDGTVIKLFRNDIYFDLGVGFDFYNEYFKFGTEIRMSYGLRNLLKKENIIYTEGIDQLRSKIFTLAFTFE
ncbi:MAG: PorT family protein [Bacteroidales bacterium]|nr:PorT family protein [Bacteroidales bacterium]